MTSKIIFLLLFSFKFTISEGNFFCHRMLNGLHIMIFRRRNNKRPESTNGIKCWNTTSRVGKTDPFHSEKRCIWRTIRQKYGQKDETKGGKEKGERESKKKTKEKQERPKRKTEKKKEEKELPKQKSTKEKQREKKEEEN